MRPTLRCLLLVLGGLPLALLPVLVAARLWPLWIAFVGLAVLLTGLDAFLSLPAKRLELDVAVPPELYIGDRGVVRLRLDVPGWRRATAVDVLLDVTGEALPQTSHATVVPMTQAIEIPLVPHRRGLLEVERVWLRWRGPWGLVSTTVSRPIEAETAVVPNVRAARAEAVRLFRRKDAWVGLKVVKHVGEGSEFESLREYTPGLDHRAIHWKASARHRKLVAQEFRAERNHQIVLAVDTGHLMRDPLGGIPKLDHAVTASLALSFVALRTGDRVGYYAFDEKVRAFAEPRGGVHAFARLQHLTADLAYTTAETNFTLGLAELSSRLRRRSFVVLFTDFVDTVTAELMVENVRRVARRHLVAFVALRDPYLDEKVEAEPWAMRDLYRAVVADGFVREREIVLRQLSRLGVFCIDAPPETVSTRLVNRYLDAKRRELVG